MSEVFYRKWRPRNMDQVVGQEPVVKTLRQAVALGRIAHAYLFCGPRGTGKTSTARILAKAVNCLAPVDGEPDNECSICVSFNEGRALDLIEIDAASNRGIDDIRELSDKIRFTPNETRYKVYIIDEVHMLTDAAFNALLKTLEEPPGHAIFILATTEIHKVPLTIISRCQRFDFRRIPIDRMTEKLDEICGAEGVEASGEALALISRASNGGLRDAENLLEQAVVSYGSPLNETQVRDLLGLGGDEEALQLAAHVLAREVKEALTVINTVAGQGSDLRQLYRGVIEYLRSALLLKSRTGIQLGHSAEIIEQLEKMCESASLEHIVESLKAFSKAEVRAETSSPLPLELAVIQSASESAGPVRPAASQQTTQAQPPAPRPAQSRSASERPPSTPQASPRTPPQQTPQSSAPATRVDEPQRDDTTAQPSPSPARSESQTGALETQLRPVARELRHVGKKYKVGALLNVCKEATISEGNLLLKFSHVSNMERMREELEDPQTRRAVKEAVAKVMGSDYEIRLGVVNGTNGSLGQRASQRSHLVNAAIKMGARVVEEKEDQPT